MSVRSFKRTNSRRAVANIVLVDGKDLPRGKYKDPKVYCYFKLGGQNAESTISNDYTNPEWRESFEFVLNHGFSEELKIILRHRISKSLNGENVGEVTLDLQNFRQDVMFEICKDVVGTECGKLRLMVTVSGISNESHNENWDIWKLFLY